MAITLLSAKQTVAGTIGGSTVATQLTAAGRAIQDALREMDSLADWEYKLTTLNDITVASGTDTYDLKVTGGGVNPKKIYTARLKNNKRTLFYVRQREYDRAVRDQQQQEVPVGYTDVRTAAGNLGIKLFPIPSGGELLQVRVYESIIIPANDGSADSNNVDVLDRHIPALLWLARGHYLIDRDSDDSRGPIYLARGQSLMQGAAYDDSKNPDEDIRFVPVSEWVGAQGPDPINDVFFDDWFS